MNKHGEQLAKLIKHVAEQRNGSIKPPKKTDAKSKEKGQTTQNRP